MRQESRPQQKGCGVERDYAILGGGVLGLTAALRLLQRGRRVTIFERESEPGGLASGFRVGSRSAQSEDVWLEKFYHHLFRSDRAIARLIAEVGLGDALEWRRPLTVTLRGGHVYQLDSPISVLKFQPIGPVDRLRMGAVLAALRVLPTPAPLEGRPAARWLRATMGAPAYEAVFDPLFRGKFGSLSGQIALPWFWARVHDRTPQLGYVRGGFQRFYNRLAASVEALGGALHLATQVNAIQPTKPSGFELIVAPVGDLGRSETHVFSRVISTLPTRLTCRLAPALPSEYRERYDWGQAYGAHCLILALDRPLTTGYWMNINDPGYPFLALVEHTNYMPAEDYGGRHLIYLGNYRAMSDPLFTMSKAQVLAEFLPHVARINPAFEPGWVTESWTFAAPYAQPIVTAEYRAHIPPFETPLAGLYAANMFQVYPHDRGQNYSVTLAEDLVRRLEGG
jgi:protoporphyrinogen oxidase